MSVSYHLQGVEFEWDENKARANAEAKEVEIIQQAASALDKHRDALLAEAV